MADVDLSLYDRQIRIYGIETQKKLSKCKIALYGIMDDFMVEVLKNLSLLGIKNVYIICKKSSSLLSPLGFDPLSEVRDIAGSNFAFDPSAFDNQNSDFDFVVCNEFANEMPSGTRIFASYFENQGSLFITNSTIEKILGTINDPLPAVISILASLCCEEIISTLNIDKKQIKSKKVLIDSVKQSASIEYFT